MLEIPVVVGGEKRIVTIDDSDPQVDRLVNVTDENGNGVYMSDLALRVVARQLAEIRKAEGVSLQIDL